MIVNETVEALDGITDFGYDSPTQFYMEFCDNCTMVVNYDDQDSGTVKLYKDGEETIVKRFDKENLYKIDQTIKEFRSLC